MTIYLDDNLWLKNLLKKIFKKKKRFGVVMVSVLASIVVDR
jgi:hypothetical protein